MNTNWTEEQDKNWLANPLLSEMMTKSITNLDMAGHCIDKAMLPLSMFKDATLDWKSRYDRAVDIQNAIEKLTKELSGLCSGAISINEKVWNEYKKKEAKE